MAAAPSPWKVTGKVTLSEERLSRTVQAEGTCKARCEPKDGWQVVRWEGGECWRA